MTEQNKKEIQLLTEQYCKGFASQSQAVKKLKDVSESTIIQMLKGRWDDISTEMWRLVGNQVGFSVKKAHMVETRVFKTCILYYNLSKSEGQTFAITGRSGCGKSYAAQWYTRSMKENNAYYLECAGYWSQKYFLKELLQEMGRNSSNLNVYEMMEDIISELRKQDHPVIILDEIDKLKEPVLLFFITLYNKLNGMCGFVWQSTDAIESRMKNNGKKIGYSELQTRISTFNKLPVLSRAEMNDLCKARGITSEEEISRAYNESDGNIRRIDRIDLKLRVNGK